MYYKICLFLKSFCDLKTALICKMPSFLLLNFYFIIKSNLTVVGKYTELQYSLLDFISIQNFRMFLYTSVYSNYLRIAKEDEEETLKAQLMTYKDQVNILFWRT